MNNLLHGENLYLPTTLTSFFLREEKRYSAECDKTDGEAVGQVIR